MIPHETYLKIKELLTTTLSYGGIAKRVGVSKGTVSVIDNERISRQPSVRLELTPFSGSYRRCPGCGAKVLMPCLACRILKMLEDQK